MRRIIILLTPILLLVLVVVAYRIHKEHSIPLINKLALNEHCIFAITKLDDTKQREELASLAKIDLRLISNNQNSPLLPQIYFQLGQIYAVKGDFKAARSVYKEILERFHHPSIRMVALRMIALTYEKEHNDDSVVKSYLRIAKDYPKSEEALAVPLYIANYYLVSSNRAEALNYLKSGENVYKSILEKNKQNSPLNFDARWFLGKAYAAEYEWEQSFATYESILFDYGHTSYLRPSLSLNLVQSINQISVDSIKDFDRPVKAYQQYISLYPQDPIDNLLKQSITSLKGLQNRVFTIKPEE